MVNSLIPCPKCVSDGPGLQLADAILRSLNRATFKTKTINNRNSSSSHAVNKCGLEASR